MFGDRSSTCTLTSYSEAHQVKEEPNEERKKKPNKTLVHDKHILTKQSFAHSSTNEPKG